MRWFIASALLLHFTATAAIAQNAFENEVRSKHQAFEAVFKKASEFARRGDTDAAENELLAILKDDRSPAAVLMIADALYNTDPQESYKLHKETFAVKPDERTTVLEWAMERHRKGEHAEAAALYQKYLKLVPDDRRMNALLADCLIRDGQLQKAIDAWEAAQHSRNHTAIDFAIYEIYGELSPAKRRGDLVKQFKAGKRELAEKLIDLDLNFNRDWWNSEVNDDALSFDLPLVQASLKTEPPRWEAIRCWVDISKGEVSASDVKCRLNKSGFILDKGVLPGSSLVAARLMAVVLDKELDTKERLLARFEKELTSRAKSKAGDVEALNILCNLSAEQKARLGEFDRLGWERSDDARFPAGLLAAMSQKGTLKADSPELTKALKQFPENCFINHFAIVSLGPDGTTTDVVVRAIKSEFRQPSPGLVIRDTDMLKNYFGLLKQKLAAEENRGMP